MNATKIDVIDDEKTLLLSDEDSITTLEFFPKLKIFKSRLELKTDVYYRNELEEYRLSVNPIEVFVRLKDRSDEPPLHHAVKDGVVLESDILSDRKERAMSSMTKEFIDGLKKEVEWHKLELPFNYVLIFYILSLHPEIISSDDFSKLLRQTEQKVKTGILKVEERLKEKKDATGLQLIDGKFGKQIQRPDDKKTTDAELEKYWNFYNSLFDKKSPEYSGISKYEFEEGSALLKFIDDLLNKESASTKQDADSNEKKSGWRWLGYGWTAVINLMTMGVVLSIYGRIQQGFETIVVSILILIYLSIQDFLMTYGQVTVATALASDEQSRRIRKLLKDEPDQDEKEAVRAAKKKLDTVMVKMYINAAFQFVIFWIALIHLLST